MVAEERVDAGREERPGTRVGVGFPRRCRAGFQALLDHPQPVARAPGEADSLRSRFRDELVVR